MAKKMGIELLDFSANEALLLKTLPFHHQDPFDRMIISQAITYAEFTFPTYLLDMM